MALADRVLDVCPDDFDRLRSVTVRWGESDGVPPFFRNDYLVDFVDRLQLVRLDNLQQLCNDQAAAVSLRVLLLLLCDECAADLFPPRFEPGDDFRPRTWLLAPDSSAAYGKTHHPS